MKRLRIYFTDKIGLFCKECRIEERAEIILYGKRHGYKYISECLIP